MSVFKNYSGFVLVHFFTLILIPNQPLVKETGSTKGIVSREFINAHPV